MEELLDERVEGHAPIGTRVTIRLPDDFHHHCRDGAQTVAVLRDAAPRFGRCLMMPNLQPPITTAVQALAYKQRILDAVPPSTFNRHSFEPLMVLYLTDKTTADEIRMAAANGLLGCKYYPAGATTNSEFGVTNPKHCQEALNEMERLQLVLCIHSEVTYGDIFTRESTFLEEVLIPLLQNHPNLSITLEHISTREAVDYVLNRAPPNVKASITCHHLLYNRNGACVVSVARSFCVVCTCVWFFSFGTDHWNEKKRTTVNRAHTMCLSPAPLFRFTHTHRLVGGWDTSTFVLSPHSQS